MIPVSDDAVVIFLEKVAEAGLPEAFSLYRLGCAGRDSIAVLEQDHVVGPSAGAHETVAAVGFLGRSPLVALSSTAGARILKLTQTGEVDNTLSGPSATVTLDRRIVGFSPVGDLVLYDTSGGFVVLREGGDHSWPESTTEIASLSTGPGVSVDVRIGGQ
ncbi:MAG: hypothetical protein GXP34_08840 [Actinobacteria bacterium]|nr:hypothetical protein [Actinomycetota bacterium]